MIKYCETEGVVVKRDSDHFFLASGCKQGHLDRLGLFCLKLLVPLQLIVKSNHIYCFVSGMENLCALLVSEKKRDLVFGLGFFCLKLRIYINILFPAFFPPPPHFWSSIIFSNNQSHFSWSWLSLMVHLNICRNAIKELSAGLKIDSSNVECIYLRASCYHVTGEYKEAVYIDFFLPFLIFLQ